MFSNNLIQQERRVIRCHNRLMTSPELCWLGAVVVTGNVTFPDNKNRRYRRLQRVLQRRFPSDATRGRADGAHRA
jgi:hypothetical protein